MPADSEPGPAFRILVGKLEAICLAGMQKTRSAGIVRAGSALDDQVPGIAGVGGVIFGPV